MNDLQNDFISGIGNTPLIKLRAASEITGCNIFGKAEFLNPGGSVKDRAALALIKDAQEKKLIAKGGTVVEGTAGNTGIGLGLLGNSLGYKTIIVMNDNQTQEKKDLLRNLGAELKLVPAKPYKDDNNFVKVAARLAEELRPLNNNGVIWAQITPLLFKGLSSSANRAATLTKLLSSLYGLAGTNFNSAPKFLKRSFFSCV